MIQLNIIRKVTIAVVSLALSFSGVIASAASADTTYGEGLPANFAEGIQHATKYAVFNSISCASAGNCTAGGYFKNAEGYKEPFTQTQTAGVWGEARPSTFAPGVASNTTENISILSVSCSTVNNCTAVGFFRNQDGYSEAFSQTQTNGVWGIAQPAVNVFQSFSAPDARFTSVSCSSPGNCTAVGWFTNEAQAKEAFMQTQTNGAWGDVVPAGFNNGIQSTTPYDSLDSVDCTSPGNCVAVGSFKNFAGAFEAFSTIQTNGAWSAGAPANFASGVQRANPSTFFSSISCASAGNCTAVGFFRSPYSTDRGFSQTLTAGTWGQATPVTFPEGVTNTAGYLNSVSCSSPGNCMAVGQFTGDLGYEGFSQIQTNGQWSHAAPASFADGVQNASTRFAGLETVSCASDGNCTAAGYFKSSAGFDRVAFTLTQANGELGQAVPVTFAVGVQAATPSAYLGAISCPSVGNCTAAGNFKNITNTAYEAFTNSISTPPVAYNVTYNSNGGSAVTASSFNVGDSISAAPTAPTRDGYTFDGWSATDGGDVISFPYSPGVTSDITLFAKWTANTAPSTTQVPTNSVASVATTEISTKTAKFPSGSSALTVAGKKAIKKVVSNSGKDAMYTVTAVASKSLGVPDSNVKALAKARAAKVKAYLIKLGVKKSQITIKIKIADTGVIPKTKIMAKYLTK